VLKSSYRPADAANGSGVRRRPTEVIMHGWVGAWKLFSAPPPRHFIEFPILKFCDVGTSSGVSFIANPHENNDTMIRKNARQRRDYLYRRAVLLKNSEISEKRAKLRAALASGKSLQDPNIADNNLRRDFQYDESAPDHTKQELLDLDDEYSELSGITDPRVLYVPFRV
jgi:hypothetical protein